MTVKYYGMYTDAGNAHIREIVENAIANRLPWTTVYQYLVDLSNSDPEQCGEATDTEVRQAVYYAIGAMQRGEDFYV